jgi:hypothetical protein
MEREKGQGRRGGLKDYTTLEGVRNETEKIKSTETARQQNSGICSGSVQMYYNVYRSCCR